jgi:hypothetical protein
MTPFIRFTLATLLGASALTAEKGPLHVAIDSKTAPGYERTFDHNQQPLPEYYAIAYGGRAEGTIWDETQQKENFPSIAGAVAQELAKQNYLFAENAENADLMLAIYWGRTNPYNLSRMRNGEEALRLAQQELNLAASTEYQTSTNQGRMGAVTDAQSRIKSALSLVRLENRMAEQRDEETARVLGYTDQMAESINANADHFQTLLNEVRDPRYYVMVVAYDFAELKNSPKKKRPAPRWVTRFSIRTRGHDFMASVPEMALRAGRYFGRPSGRLIRDYEGAVEFGELQEISSNAGANPNIDSTPAPKAEIAAPNRGP